MRKVFLEDLPKWETGRNKGKIDWRESVGKEVGFIYEGLEGKFKIKDYNEGIVTIYLNNTEHSIRTHALINAKLGGALGIKTRKFKYNVGEEIEVKSGRIKIIKQHKVKKHLYYEKAYIYKCLNCDHENSTWEASIVKKVGCPVCANRIVKNGINDMWTTNPRLAKMLKLSEDGCKYAEGSGELLDWLCPHCNNIIYKKSPKSVSRFGLACRNCSDGISYPEKVVFNVLKQLTQSLEVQKIFDWSQNKRYDFYINSHNIIIEVHGIQHYEKTPKGWRKLEVERKNDILKKEIAHSNNIKNYIIIDARHSDIKYIKESILQSELNNIFDLSKINWLTVQENSCKSLVKEAVELWNKGIKSTVKIGEQLKLSSNTIGRYLKQGNDLGWCDFSTEVAREHQWNKYCIEVIQMNKRGEYYNHFKSIKEASSQTKVAETNISLVCKGKRKSAGGYKWMYKEDYEKYISEQNKELVLT